MSEAQTHIQYELLMSDSETTDGGHGGKITTLALLLRANGKEYSVAVSGPEPLPLKDAVNALHAARAYTYSIFGIDPTSVMKDTRIVDPADARGDRPLNG